MSFEEDDPESDREPEVNETENAPKNGIFFHVSNFFGWLGDLVAQQAHLDAENEEMHPPLHLQRAITLQKQKASEVIDNAVKICDRLDDVKEKLFLEFGQPAAGFISKCIDPMVAHARKIIADLTNPEHASRAKTGLLDQAIESVELYSQFSDEKQLKRKIVQVGLELIKQTIDHDLEVLANYKRHAIATSDWASGEKEEREVQIDAYLNSLIKELLAIGDAQFERDDLHTFFLWKSSIDDRRNSLLELGFLVIDAMTESSEKNFVISDVEPEDEIFIEEPLPDLVKSQIEKSSLAMSFLATLEDRVCDIFSRIEATHLQDSHSVREIEQLIEYIKVDAERFAKIGAHAKYVLDCYASIKQSILHAEHLLSDKKENNSF